MSTFNDVCKVVQMIQNMKPYFDMIKSSQKRKTTYLIKDVLRMLFLACKDSNKAREEETVRMESLNGASSGNISFWKKKIVVHDAYTHMFKHTIIPASAPRVIAVDGSVIAINISSDGVKRVGKASMTLCSLLDVDSNMIVDYAISESCDEISALRTQIITSLQPTDLIVCDRNYGNFEFLKSINNDIRFITRLPVHLNIVTYFKSEKKVSSIIDYNGMAVKLVRYRVDKKTKQIILDHYGELSQKDDSESEFILATNDLTLTNIQCIDYYKQRWNIEVGFKHLKSNFDVRNPLRTYKCCDIRSYIAFPIAQSMAMYNISTYIRSIYLKTTGKSVRMTRCIAEVRGLFDKIIQDPLYSIMDSIIGFMRQFKKHLLAKPNILNDANKDGIKNTGRYRSKMTVDTLMLQNRVYMYLVEYI